MIAGALLPAWRAIHTSIDKSIRGHRVQQEKIDAEPRVTVPAIALVVPERIHWLIGVAGADGIDPALIEQTPEAGAAFGL